MLRICSSTRLCASSPLGVDDPPMRILTSCELGLDNELQSGTNSRMSTECKSSGGPCQWTASCRPDARGCRRQTSSACRTSRFGNVCVGNCPESTKVTALRRKQTKQAKKLTTSAGRPRRLQPSFATSRGVRLPDASPTKSPRNRCFPQSPRNVVIPVATVSYGIQHNTQKPHRRYTTQHAVCRRATPHECWNRN